MKALRNWPAPAILAPNGKPWNVYLIQGDDFFHDIISAEGMPTFMSTWYSGFFHFPYACAEIPVCFPGRSATLTGKRGVWSEVKGNNDGTQFAAKAINYTIFTNLKRKGYKTAFVGKGYNQLGKGGGWGTLPFFHPGVDYQCIQWGAISYFNWSELGSDGTIRVEHAAVDTNTTGTDYAIDVERLRILEFLSETPVGQPWFVYHSTKGCHQGDVGAPLPPSRYAATPVTYTDDPSFGLSVAQSGVPSWLLDEQESPWNSTIIDQIHADHVEGLRVGHALDEAVDVVLTQIAARGEADNTIVIIKCDNTIASGEHRLTGKGTPHRSGLNIQLHIKVPGLTPFTSDQPIMDLDIAPFIYAMCGVTPMVSLDGASFHRHLQDADVVHRDAALCVSYANSSPFSSLRFNDRTYYEMEAHDELTDVQAGGWLYADGEAEHATPSAGEDHAKLVILNQRLGTIAPE